MGPWPHMAFFWLENRSKTTRRAFFPGVDAIKRLPPDQHRSPEAGKACGCLCLCCGGKIHSLFLRKDSLPPSALYRASSFVNQSVSRDITLRVTAATARNSHPSGHQKYIFASNVNCVLGWELFPGFKITAVNRNVMFRRACVSPSRFCSHGDNGKSYCLQSTQATCTGRGSSRQGVVKARPPSSS